jgi:hypothetical protein
MNSDLLAAFLNDNNGFDGGAFELFTKLKYRNEFRSLPDLPACGEDFLSELRTKIPDLKARGVDVCLLNGGVRIKTALESREDQSFENLWRAEYNASAQLRREFTSFASYAAYQRASASGRVHTTTRVANQDNRGSQSNVAPQSTVDSRLPVEERCRQRWELEPAIRAEFHENYAAFLAYEKANARGQVRLFRRSA